MTPRLSDVAAVLVDQQDRAAHCIERQTHARGVLALAEEQRTSSATPMQRIDVFAARENVKRWDATTRAVLDDYSRFMADWNAVQQQFPAANDACAAEAVLTSSSKPDTLVKLLKLGALDKGAIFEITGWALAAVEATIAYLLEMGKITFVNGNQTRTYCVVPS